jgi:hypothetical protein
MNTAQQRFWSSELQEKRNFQKNLKQIMYWGKMFE